MQCISKGKEHKKYEFGNKVSIIRSATGIILVAKSFRNEYDGHTMEESLLQVERISCPKRECSGHTMEESLLQVERITGKKVRRLAGDRDYRGREEVNGMQS